MFKPASISGQDLFVYRILECKRNGIYLDIGCGNPFDENMNNDVLGNNTYIFSEMEWCGIGIDKKNFSHIWYRDKKFINENPEDIDWEKLIYENSILQNNIDYISLFCDNMIKVIENIPWKKINSKIITLRYQEFQDKESIRKILIKNGYDLVCKDVKLKLNFEEDWWVNPTQINMDIANKFRSEGQLGIDIATKDISTIFKIPVPVADCLNKYSILNVKKIKIKNDDTLYWINKQLDILNPLVHSYLINYKDIYEEIYKINMEIWELRELKDFILIEQKKNELTKIKYNLNILTNSFLR
jgi:hypothetical protein